MNYHVQQSILKTIQGSESILWLSQPNRFKMVQKKIPLFFFSFFWNAFVVFWMWGASGFGSELSLFSLFGIPFLIVGIWLFLSPFLEYFFAPNKAYAVTESRILIFSNWRKGRFKQELIQNIRSLKIKHKNKSLGDLSIEINPPAEDTSEIIKKTLAKMSPEKAENIDLSKMEERLKTLQTKPYTISFLAADRINDAYQILNSKISTPNY